jgi:hypothetical protein
LPWLRSPSALGAGLGACGGDGDSGAGTRTLEIGSPYSVDIGDTGDQLGYKRLKEERGISVDYREIGREPTGTVAGLIRGDYGVAKLGLDDVMPVIAQGADVRLILSAATIPDQLFIRARGKAGLAR